MDARDGEIGKVKEFYFDDQNWEIRYLVADTGGWLSGRRVLISPYALDPANEGGKIIPVDLTKCRIQGSPSLDTDRPVSRQYERGLLLLLRLAGLLERPVHVGAKCLPCERGIDGRKHLAVSERTILISAARRT